MTVLSLDSGFLKNNEFGLTDDDLRAVPFKILRA
jgi:hypothetical protein